MCDPVVASFGSGAVKAIGGAQAAKQENEARSRDYKYKLQVRENRWMRERSTYQTKIVQYQQNLSESNMAAQRAYTRSQINLNNVRERAMLDHSEDFKSMLIAQGDILSSAAERGIRGAGVRRMMVGNIAKLGLANASRARALTETQERYYEHNENVRMKNKSNNNSLYGKVAISPVEDIPPPQPVMKNVGATLFMGLAGAAFDAMGSYESSSVTEKPS